MNEGSPATGSSRPVVPHWLSRILSFVHSVKIHRTERKLRLCESLALGDKRFLAVVQCEGERFLVGVTNQSVSLLHRLPAENSAPLADIKLARPSRGTA